MKNPKLVIGIIAIIALVIIFYLLLRNSQRVTTVQGGTTVTQPNFFDTLANLFNPKGTSTSTSAGQPFYCKIFPKLCDNNYDIKTCDCKNPGYTLEGDLTPSCSQIGSQYEKDCA